jgi:DNA-binding GntR family transcriptional regulator
MAMAEFHRPATAQAAVLAELRARILSGALAPGTALRQDDLAGELGVSRVPLREALRILESEGHVTYAAHRGYRVVELSLADLTEIYRLRTVIEDDLARASVAVLAEEDLVALGSAHDQLAALERLADPDLAALAAANRAFHWAILRPGPRAHRVLTTLWDASDAYRAHWFAARTNVERGAREHAQLLAAAQHRDAEGVVRLLDAHRSGAVAALREVLGR